MDKSGMGKKARRRGADAEREWCRMATEALGESFRRNLRQYQVSDGDVEMGPYLVEVKCQSRIAEREWWKQAVAQAKARRMIPVLAYKLSRQGWRVLLPMPEAWTTGEAWREELAYTQTLRPEGFFMLAREYL